MTNCEWKRLRTSCESSHEEAPRGRIFDVKGRVLVDNLVVHSVSIDRSELTAALDDDSRTAMVVDLAQILSRSGRLTKVADISARLASHEFGPFDKVPVALDISPELLVYLGERSNLFPGVSVEERTIRNYPYGHLAAHVLGYVGPLNAQEYNAKLAQIDPSTVGAKTYQLGDEIGKSGVERIFENELRGTPGQRVFEVNAFNEIVAEHNGLNSEPVPGNDVYLTIDVDVQYLLEGNCDAACTRHDASPSPKTHPTPPIS